MCDYLVVSVCVLLTNLAVLEGLNKFVRCSINSGAIVFLLKAEVVVLTRFFTI